MAPYMVRGGHYMAEGDHVRRRGWSGRTNCRGDHIWHDNTVYIASLVNMYRIRRILVKANILKRPVYTDTFWCHSASGLPKYPPPRSVALVPAIPQGNKSGETAGTPTAFVSTREYTVIFISNCLATRISFGMLN